MNPAPRPTPVLGLTVLVVGLLGISHGSIFVRLADADPIVVSFFRVGIAALIVAPPALVLRWGEFRTMERRAAWLAVGAGIMLALHFAAWVSSLDHTAIANSVVLVTLSPIWIALFTAVVSRRRPHGAVIASCALAVVGCAIIGVGSAGGGGQTSLYGDFLAFLGGLFVAGYLLFGRAARSGGMSLLVYVALCYGVAAATLGVAVVTGDHALTGLSTTTYGAMIAMAVVSQVIGHSSFNWGLKMFSPGFVAVCILGEPILAPILGQVYFGETIPTATWIGAAFILPGIWLGTRVEISGAE